MTDVFTSPAHYQQAPHGIPGQPFDFAPHMDGLRFTAFRYVWRAGFKQDAAGDIRKALVCITREITHGNGVVTGKPGHLTHALRNSPHTLRRDLLTDLWERHNLERTHQALSTALSNPATLDTPRSHQ